MMDFRQPHDPACTPFWPRGAAAALAVALLVPVMPAARSAEKNGSLPPSGQSHSRRPGQDWWSLQPVKRPAIPQSDFDRLAKNPIDRFLFAELASNGLRPSAPASRLALLRRVTIDLTGLPPTPGEAGAFLADTSPGAYEKVVDRLLASPAYGERWARHWLDVVRFGESNGYEQNHLRSNAWPYRDYVVRSFNADKPYTRFVAEQLAGDALAKGDPDTEVATGFLVAGVHDTVGIQTVEGSLQQRFNDLDDMVSTIGATFLGLTVGCAKCHDHKFDPIPQKDYYRLAAVVAGVRHGERPLAGEHDSGQRAIQEVNRRLHRLSGQIGDLDAQARVAVLRSQGAHPVPRAAVSARRNVEEFAPVRARFVRLHILATRDGAEPCLDELEVFGPDSEHNLALASRGAKASASSLLPGYPIHQVHHLNDGRYGNDWSWISNEPGRGWAQIELPKPETVSRVIWSRDAAGDQARFQDRLASDYRLKVSQDGKTWQTVASSADRAAAAEAIPAEALHRALSRADQGRRDRLAQRLAELSQEAARLASPATAYVGQFAAPDAMFVLKRGDVMHRGRAVTPGALSQVPDLSAELAIDPGLGEGGRRLALARWITDPKNPLTARVMVNRVWQHHFGRGLVGTPSDFGANGEKPSHPALLDWLAADFLAHGGRLKRLHRLIVTSASYRQSSDVNGRGAAADAGNQLLWRMPLRRMEAEAVRDAVLAASGKLDRRMGGPGFRLFKYRIVNVAIYEPLEVYAPETWRRGVYRQAARAIREDLLGNLDSPECAQRTPRRDVTITPLQALSLLNGPFLVQQARFFADRVRRETGARPDEQVDRAFRLAFGRSPAAAEQRAAMRLLMKSGLPALCRALLNANEFLYY
jgi:hypothetical protein